MEGNVFSYGNLKLPRSTAIFNITSSKDCPSAKLGLCNIASICYAKKAERLYPKVLPFRRRQTEFWDSCTEEEFINRLEDPKLLRFSESGDFRHQRDVIKVSGIAERLKKRFTRVYVYTARKDLNFDNVSDNLTIVGNEFMVHNAFVVVNKYHLDEEVQKALADGKKVWVCPMNCRICNQCTKRNKLWIFAPKH